MKILSLQGKQGRSKYRSYRAQTGKITENLLSKDFKSLRAYEKLATDVTEFSMCNEKV